MIAEFWNSEGHQADKGWFELENCIFFVMGHGQGGQTGFQPALLKS